MTVGLEPPDGGLLADREPGRHGRLARPALRPAPDGRLPAAARRSPQVPVANVVDANYSVVVKAPKRLLPAAHAFGGIHATCGSAPQLSDHARAHGTAVVHTACGVHRRAPVCTAGAGVHDPLDRRRPRPCRCAGRRRRRGRGGCRPSGRVVRGHREQGGHVEVPVVPSPVPVEPVPGPTEPSPTEPSPAEPSPSRSPASRRPHPTGPGGGRTHPAPLRDRRCLPGRSRPRRVRSCSPPPRPPRAAPPPQRRAARRGGGCAGGARTETSRPGEPPAARPARAGARGARPRGPCGRCRPLLRRGRARRRCPIQLCPARRPRPSHPPRRSPDRRWPACPSPGRPPQGRPPPARTRGSAPSGIRCVACRRRSLFSFGVSAQGRRLGWVVLVSELCASCGTTPAAGRDHHRFYRGERASSLRRGGFLPASHPRHVGVSTAGAEG